MLFVSVSPPILGCGDIDLSLTAVRSDAMLVDDVVLIDDILSGRSDGSLASQVWADNVLAGDDKSDILSGVPVRWNASGEAGAASSLRISVEKRRVRDRNWIVCMGRNSFRGGEDREDRNDA